MAEKINRQVECFELTVVEKVVVLYYGLVVAKEAFFEQTNTAFSKGWINSKERRDWEHFFNSEYNRCREIELKTYRNLAWLEFKVKYLIGLTLGLPFLKG